MGTVLQTATWSESIRLGRQLHEQILNHTAVCDAVGKVLSKWVSENIDSNNAFSMAAIEFFKTSIKCARGDLSPRKRAHAEQSFTTRLSTIRELASTAGKNFVEVGAGKPVDITSFTKLEMEQGMMAALNDTTEDGVRKMKKFISLMLNNDSFLQSVAYVARAWRLVEKNKLTPPIIFLVDFWSNAVKFATRKLTAGSSINDFLDGLQDEMVRFRVLADSQVPVVLPPASNSSRDLVVETTTTFSEIGVEQEMIAVLRKQSHFLHAISAKAMQSFISDDIEFRTSVTRVLVKWIREGVAEIFCRLFSLMVKFSAGNLSAREKAAYKQHTSLNGNVANCTWVNHQVGGFDHIAVNSETPPEFSAKEERARMMNVAKISSKELPIREQEVKDMMKTTTYFGYDIALFYEKTSSQPPMPAKDVRPETKLENDEEASDSDEVHPETKLNTQLNVDTEHKNTHQEEVADSEHAEYMDRSWAIDWTK